MDGVNESLETLASFVSQRSGSANSTLLTPLDTRAVSVSSAGVHIDYTLYMFVHTGIHACTLKVLGFSPGTRVDWERPPPFAISPLLWFYCGSTYISRYAMDCPTTLVVVVLITPKCFHLLTIPSFAWLEQCTVHHSIGRP